MNESHDFTLEALIDLDGFIAEIGEGYWVKIEAKKVKKDQESLMELSILLPSIPQREKGY